jgi:hypothetical protein
MSVDGWKAIVGDHDESDMCSLSNVFLLRLKAGCMYAALAHALSIYDNSNTSEVQPTFKHICQLAIDTVNNPLDDLFIDDIDKEEA